MYPLASLITGIFLLLIATNILIRKAISLSNSLKLSPLIIGLTVVAIGTSLPELIVSVLALINKDPGLALGNIVGSNIINILLIMAVGILLGDVRIGSVKTQRNALFLLAITLLFPSLFLLKIPSIAIFIILISLAILFTVIEYRWGVKGRQFEDKLLFKLSKKQQLKISDIVIFIISIAVLFLGGSLIVSSVEELARLTHLSTTFFGLSITAVATSLPELFTTIISKNKKQDKIMIGNILGSNLYNIMLIGGIISLGLPSFALPFSDIVFYLLSCIIGVCVVVLFKGKIVPRSLGAFLLLLCIFYFVSLAK